MLGGGDLGGLGGGEGLVAGLGVSHPDDMMSWSSEEEDTSMLCEDFFLALILFFLVGSVVF